LLTDRNVNENLKFVLKVTGWKDVRLMEEKVADVLDKVGLKSKGHKMPFEMSGGEQQRVDIARALLNSPKLILADEPTGNLDPETSDEIMQLLFRISADYGTTIIMATHDYRVINKFPARMVRTERGQVIDNATLTIDYAAAPDRLSRGGRQSKPRSTSRNLPTAIDQPCYQIACMSFSRFAFWSYRPASNSFR
jgi:cell division transport system ATP-binding protein